MKIFRQKKKSMTLLEIMIVIFLIGLIGSVIGYNVKGSLESGKAFKSEHGAAQIRDILLLEASNGTDIALIVKNKKEYLENSGLCKDVEKMLKDGWGKDYTITENKGDIDVISPGLETYKKKKKPSSEEIKTTDVSTP